MKVTVWWLRTRAASGRDSVMAFLKLLLRVASRAEAIADGAIEIANALGMRPHGASSLSCQGLVAYTIPDTMEDFLERPSVRPSAYIEADDNATDRTTVSL